MLLLTCLAGYVMVVEYYHNGIHLLFTVMMLIIALWVGHCLWEDPDKSSGGPDDPRVPIAPKEMAADPAPAPDCVPEVKTSRSQPPA